MNVSRVLRSARKILTASAVAVAAVTVLGSGATTASPENDRSGVSEATKEWKAPVRSKTADIVLATKEWKRPTQLTKEW